MTEKNQQLLPTIIQDYKTGEVLMLAYSNRDSLKKAKSTEKVWLYSRTRKKLWQKGEKSGNEMRIMEIRTDCDRDALLFRVIPKGPACHRNTRSCFTQGKKYDTKTLEFSHAINELWQILQLRKKIKKKKSYTQKLYVGGIKKINKKIIEEAYELTDAGSYKNKKEIIWEFCDLFYHCLILLAKKDVKLDKITKELARRQGK